MLNIDTTEMKKIPAEQQYYIRAEIKSDSDSESDKDSIEVQWASSYYHIDNVKKHTD
eukprot:CAMPEP_0184856886 /NCGR_PEP_ID=MMETSP0580-20130426/2050_1 /TAXON_ID=1118495 /ORGANISM="Dactyliosolen fragilissimus" /LENGTH=56 /DNA_ID=CAMNT_0027352149 /DNA_START=832 /DNA_END=1002 /DNA_ORIENTATION=+